MTEDQEEPTENADSCSSHVESIIVALLLSVMIVVLPCFRVGILV